MKQHEFDELRGQLEPIRPILQALAHHHGLIADRSVGRYPRLRYDGESVDGVRIGIDFWMSFDEAGQYRRSCTDETPYELAGVASVTRLEADGLYRYSLVRTAYAARPYKETLKTLREDADRLLDELKSTTRSEVLARGRRTRLPNGNLADEQ